MGKANHDADMQMKTLDGIELLKVRARLCCAVRPGLG